MPDKSSDHSVFDTLHLGLDVLDVTRDEVFEVSAGGQVRFRVEFPDHSGEVQLPAREAEHVSDIQRTVEHIEAHLPSVHSRATYRPFILNFLLIAYERKLKFHDLALVRGWILAIAAGAHPDKPAKVATLRVAMAALRALYEHVGRSGPLADGPTNRWFKALRYKHSGPVHQAEPLLTKQLIRVVRTIRKEDDLLSLRNAALIILGWSAALRRSELCRIEIPHFKKAETRTDLDSVFSGAWTLHIPRSKGDRKRLGQEVPLYRSKDQELNVFDAIDQWRTAAGITSGFLFRQMTRSGEVLEDAMTPHQIYAIAKKYFPEGDFSPHSLRSGFVTSAALKGKTIPQIQTITRHKTGEQVERYLRRVNAPAQGTGPIV